jgi:hypothetical protein
LYCVVLYPSKASHYQPLKHQKLEHQKLNLNPIFCFFFFFSSLKA